MKPQSSPSFDTRHPAFSPIGLALLAAFTLFTTAARAPAQTGWGNALALDGMDDYVLADAIPLANASFTIEAWTRRDTTGTMGMIMAQGGGASHLGLMFGFHWDWVGFVFDFYGDGVTSLNIDNAWHHWAGTYDASNGVQCLYRDGVLLATNVASQHYQGSGPLYIGRAPFDNPAYFAGVIDEVRIWNVPRSAGQIRQHLSHPLTGAESNLVAYWNFDEDAGTTAHDSTTHGWHGTLNGPQWTVSTIPPWGKALSLDGLGDPVAVTNFGSVMPTNEVTVEFWLRIITNKYEWPVIFGLNPDQTANRFLAHLPCRYFYEIYWHCGDINAGGRCECDWEPVPLGEWRHFAFVASQSGNFMAVFVNGAPHHSVSNFNTFERGDYTLELGRLVVGELDEFRIWNKARSAEEIQADLFHPLTGAESNLVAYWNFDEGAGTNTFDATPNARHGVQVNGIAWTHSTVPTAPVFVACTMTAPGQLRLQATGSAGVTYTLHSSTNLVSWVNLTNLVADTNGLIECVEELDTEVPARFYRASWP